MSEQGGPEPRGPSRDDETAPTEDASSIYESWLVEAARISDPPPAPALPMLESGAVLGDGRFAIERAIGRGGMGAVYAARDHDTGAEVALKTLLVDDPLRLLALKQEFRTLRGLGHENLISLGELFEDAGRWFFTMERIDGEHLLDHVRPEGAVDHQRLVKALVQLARGLIALHSAGLVHRDVKPSNTLVDHDGRVILLDFGLIAHATPVFDERHVAGTLAYMAPEQLAGRSAGPASDWYAVGVMLFEALTGVLPATVDARTPTEHRRIARPDPARLAAAPPSLRQLCLALLEPDPADRPDGWQVLATLGAGDTESAAERRAVFVGREAHLRALRHALERCRDSGPRVVHVRGESGIGKSALVGELLRRERARETITLTSRCYEREHLPFKAVDGIVDDLARHLAVLPAEQRRELLPRGAGALAHMFPVLRRVLPPGAPSADPRETRRRAAAALREILKRLAMTRPLLLAIDDGQWADEDSLTLLEGLLAPGGPAALLVVTSRGEPNAERFETIAPAEALEVGGLSASESSELVTALATGPDPVDARRVAALGSGHPLFLTELVRFGSSSARSDLDEALRAHASSVSGELHRLAELVALSAGPLRLQTLAHAADAAPSDVARTIRRLEVEHLLRLTGGGCAVEPYHDRLRRALVAEIPGGRRRVAHRRLAEALETHEPDAHEPLAVHLEAAGDAAGAHRHAVRAARAAVDALAFERAARLYRWALQLAPGARGEWSLHTELGSTLGNLGRGAEAAAAYQAASARAPAARRAELDRCAAEQLLRAGHIDQGLEAMDRVLHQIRMDRPRSLPQTLLGLTAERARLALTRRPAQPVATPDQLRVLDTCWAVAMCMSMVDPIPGTVFQRRFLRLARKLGQQGREAVALGMVATSAATGGPPAKRAHRLLAEARAMAAGSDDPRVDAYLSLSEATVAFLTGSWTEAYERAEHTIEVFRDRCVGVAWELATAQRLALTSLWHTGRLDELCERVEEVRQEAEGRGDLYAVTQLQTTVLPVAYLVADRPALAMEELEDALARWSQRGTFLQHWQHMQAKALVLIYEGRAAEALAFTDARIPEIGRALLFRIHAIRTFTQFVQAGAAIGAARTSPHRDRLLARAAREAETLGAHHGEVASVAAIRGQIAHLAGRPDEAIRELRAAITGFERLGMEHLVAAIAAPLGRLIGGDEQRTLEARSRAWLDHRNIVDERAFLRILAPGLEDLR